MEVCYRNWMWLAFTHYDEVAITSMCSIAVEVDVSPLEPSLEAKLFSHMYIYYTSAKIVV